MCPKSALHSVNSKVSNQRALPYSSSASFRKGRGSVKTIVRDGAREGSSFFSHKRSTKKFPGREISQLAAYKKLRFH